MPRARALLALHAGYRACHCGPAMAVIHDAVNRVKAAPRLGPWGTGLHAFAELCSAPLEKGQGKDALARLVAALLMVDNTTVQQHKAPPGPLPFQAKDILNVDTSEVHSKIRRNILPIHRFCTSLRITNEKSARIGSQYWYI